jgi:hypothetical protein
MGVYVKEASLIFFKKREEKNAFRKEQRKRFSGHLERNKYQRVFFFFFKRKDGMCHCIDWVSGPSSFLFLYWRPAFPNGLALAEESIIDERFLLFLSLCVELLCETDDRLFGFGLFRSTRRDESDMKE